MAGFVFCIGRVDCCLVICLLGAVGLFEVCRSIGWKSVYQLVG